MGMVFVAVTAAVDVGPHVADPCHGEVAGIRALASGPFVIGRHAVGEVARVGEQLDARRAAPAIHVPAGLPAPHVGLVGARMTLLPLLDNAAQLGIERRRVRYVEHDERRGKQGHNFGDVTHTPCPLTRVGRR